MHISTFDLYWANIGPRLHYSYLIATEFWARYGPIHCDSDMGRYGPIHRESDGPVTIFFNVKKNSFMKNY